MMLPPFAVENARPGRLIRLMTAPQPCYQSCMIGKLKGLIDSYGEDFVIVDVQGVGYVVQCSSRTLQRLPAIGEAASLSIETHVREDAIRLYGFLSDVERDWFRMMQMVQGVGAKVALAILSTLEPGALATAISSGDKAAVARAPGVGPKLAQRICAELKDKAPAFGHVDPGVAQLAGALEDKRLPQPVADAVSALVNLGYPQAQAVAAVAAASRELGETAGTAQLIRQGLKELAK
jgi:Holliday junction DNA helicase RuvA